LPGCGSGGSPEQMVVLYDIGIKEDVMKEKTGQDLRVISLFFLSRAREL
jgi:hypothetical protein